MLTEEFLLVPWYALEGSVVGIILFFSSNFPSNRVKKRLFVRSLMCPDSSTRALNGNLDFTTTVWVGLLCTCCCILLFLRSSKKPLIVMNSILWEKNIHIGLPFQWWFGVERIVLPKWLHSRLLVQLFLFADRSHLLKRYDTQINRDVDDLALHFRWLSQCCELTPAVLSSRVCNRHHKPLYVHFSVRELNVQCSSAVASFYYIMSRISRFIEPLVACTSYESICGSMCLKRLLLYHAEKIWSGALSPYSRHCRTIGNAKWKRSVAPDSYFTGSSNSGRMPSIH